MPGPRALPILLGLLCFVFARPARGMLILPTPDTETLTVESRLIVEATLVDKWSEVAKGYGNNVELWHVRVSSVLAGPIAAEPKSDGADRQDPAVPMPPVTTHDVISVAGITGKPGDRVLLFLSHRSERFAGPSAYGATSADWVCPPFHARYLDDTHAYFSSSRTDPTTRPRSPMDFDPTARLKPLTIDELLRRVRAALDEQPALQATIDRATAADLGPLFAICRARREAKPDEPGCENHWAREASVKISELADAPTILSFALSKEKVADTGYSMGSVLGFRDDCREAALRALEDPGLPADQRRNLMEVFRFSSPGWGYHQSVGQHGTAPNGGRFATRVAKLAAAAKDEREADSLLSMIRDCAPGKGFAPKPAMADDLAAAMDVFTAAWPTMSPTRRFETLGTMLTIAPERARQFAPDLGPFITVLQLQPLVGGGAHAVAGPATLRFSYEWRNLLHPGDPPARLSLVLRPIADADGHKPGPLTELSLDEKTPQLRSDNLGGQFGGSTLAVAIPAVCGPGRYTAWLRVRSGEQILGDGFACEVELPAK